MTFLSVDDGRVVFVSSMVFIRSFKAFFIFDLSLLLCLTMSYFIILLVSYALATYPICLDFPCSIDLVLVEYL